MFYKVNDKSYVLQMYEPSSKEEAPRQSQLNSRLHEDYGIDYFITPRHGFPWQQIPALVIGRPEVDNFVVSYCFVCVTNRCCLVCENVSSVL